MKIKKPVWLWNLFFWIGLMAAGSTMAVDLVTEVVTLRHRTAAQLLPLIQPLVAQPGTVSGFQGDLVIRTSRSNLAEIKKVLGTLDRAPRRLSITVRHDAPVDRRADGGALRGDAAASGPRVYGTQALALDRHEQRLQVDEGSEATIQVGRFVPVTSRRTVRRVIGARVQDDFEETVEYREVTTGFMVRPRLLGNTVTLETTPRRDTPGRQDSASTGIQRLTTTVSGRLGEWIELGAVSVTDASASGAYSYGTPSLGDDARRILVKVEVLD